MVRSTRVSGEELRQQRMQLNLTLKEVAEALELDKSTISRYENDKIGYIKKPVIDAILNFYEELRTKRRSFIEHHI